MNDNLSRAGLTILIIVSILLSVTYVKHLADREPQVIYIQDPNYVQPPCEAQRRLKEQGLYRGKIDGIWGKQTDKAFCNYRAIREIEQALEAEKKE